MKGIRCSTCHRTLLLSWILQFSLISGVICQNFPSFRQFKREQGLSQNSVIAIAQDKDGFIWVGTRNGLNKYDGYHFRPYGQNRSTRNHLIDNDVRVLDYQSSSNCLWVGTDLGLSAFDIARDTFISYQIGDQSHHPLRFCYHDSNNNIWVGSGDKLYQKKTSSDHFIPVSVSLPSESSSAIVMNNILEESHRRFWLATDQGLYLVNHIGDKLEKMDLPGPYLSLSGLRETPVSVVVKDENRNLWIGSRQDGFYRWNSQDGKLTNYRNERNSGSSAGSDRIQCFAVTEKGDAWIGTGNGLKFFDKEQNQINDFLVDSKVSVRSICIDRKGSLWVGTYFDGLFYLDRDWGVFNHHKSEQNKNSLSYKVVGAMVEDQNSKIWVATEGGGINYFDPVQAKIIKVIDKGLSGNNIKSLFLDEHTLWAGTFGKGLNRYDTRTGKITQYRADHKDQNSLPHDNVYSIQKIDSQIWLATYGGGICRLNSTGKQFGSFQNIASDSTSLSSNLCRVLYKDNSGDLWIGTDKGLNLLLKKDDSRLFKRFLQDQKILCIYQAPSGLFWIGTRSNGLFSLKITNSQYLVQKVPTLGDQSIYGILADEKQYLWLSTDHGMHRFNPDDQSVISFSDADGLENTEFNFNAYLKSRKGDFYFGSTDGLITFNPSEIDLSTYIAPLVFSELLISNRSTEVPGKNDHSIQYTDHLIFDYNDARFTLSFPLLDYAAPSDNVYQYRLEGIDEGWKESRGNPYATYTIQRDGEYTFRCRAGNHQGFWNPAERHLQITVLPPFYRTGTAYILYAVLFLGGILLVYYFVKLRKRLYVEKMSMQQQMSLHEARLRLYTDIAHEFKNPLTLILSPIEVLLKKYGQESLIAKELIYARDNALHLLELINQLLSFRRAETDHLKLEVRETNLVPFSKRIFHSFDRDAREKSIEFQFHSTAEQILAWIDRDKMSKVLGNLLSNALNFTPKGGMVFFELVELKGAVEWKVRDSGPGIPAAQRETIFDRFFTTGEGNGTIRSGSGIGLALCKKMTELHQGIIYCNKESSKGAEFLVKIPKGRDHFMDIHLADDSPVNDDVRVFEADENPKRLHAVFEDTIKPGRKDAILLVEDNKELLAYLTQKFKDNYEVYTASNGLDGIALAQKHLPDLIIADIMMEKMSGLDLCQQIKSQLETSHIPIILLTAKSSKSSILQGLQLKADDYVVKPFDPDELILKVGNLLESRRLFRSRIVKTLNLDPEKLNLTSLDDAFIDKAMRILEVNMGNTEFSVEDFAREMMVSRQILFTKVKALTSMTPNNLIKTVRLKRAHQILMAGSFTIAEVSRKVGFKDPRYFTKCFVRQYKALPSEVENSNFTDFNP